MNGKPGVLAVMITAASIADRLGYADFEEKCNRARATVERLAEKAQKVGELIHNWRESGMSPNLRELANANEELAAAIAAFRGEQP